MNKAKQPSGDEINFEIFIGQVNNNQNVYKKKGYIFKNLFQTLILTINTFFEVP